MNETELPNGPASLDEVEVAIVNKLEALLLLLPAGPALEMGGALVVDMRESSKTRRLMGELDDMALKAKQSFNLRRSRVQFAMEDGFRKFLDAYQRMLAKLRSPKPAAPKRRVPAPPKAPAAPDFKLLSADDLRKQILGIQSPGTGTIRTTGNIWEGWAPSDSHKASDVPPKKKPDDNRS